MLQKSGRKNRVSTDTLVVYRTNTDEKTNFTKNMRKLALSALIFLYTSFGFAQQSFSISARVQDVSSGDFLPFATVTLRDASNNKLIGRAVSD